MLGSSDSYIRTFRVSRVSHAEGRRGEQSGGGISIRVGRRSRAYVRAGGRVGEGHVGQGTQQSF